MGIPDGYEPSQRVWIGNLPPDATDTDLDAHFRQLSEPVNATIFKTGQGCVTYQTAEEAEMAISAFNGSEVGGSIIKTGAWSKAKGKGKGAGNESGGMEGKGAKGKSKGKGKDGWGMDSFGKDSLASWMQSFKGNKGWGKGWDDGAWGKGLVVPPWMWVKGALGGGKWGKGGGKWGGKWHEEEEEKPKKQKWTPPVTAAYNIELPAGATLPAEGLPPTAPAVVYDKEDNIFKRMPQILKEFVEDPDTMVEVVHDPDWEQFPEIGEALKQAMGEESCFCVVTCSSKNIWAIGVGPGWKGREPAGKVALALALAAQDIELAKTVGNAQWEFDQLCKRQGLYGTPPAAANGQGADGEIPPIHFITVPSDSKIVAAGLPAEAPAAVFTKAQKEFFSNSHSILCEFVEDPKEEVAFEDDPDCDVFPDVYAACQAAGAEENGICVASHAGLSAWAVGMGPGQEGRQRAAKLALGLTLAQRQGKLEEFAANYPEFGSMLANVGLVAPQAKKRRKGKW